MEYNGAAYHGWQRQTKPAVPTVQAELERAIAFVANQDISLICAGRTDAGVHATGQVAHFEVSVQRENKAWVMGVNSQLPAQIRVLWAKEFEPRQLELTQPNSDFHARFSATARRYQYWIHNSPVKPGIFSGMLSYYPKPLDEQRMHQAAQALLGEQDFSAFRAIACESNTPMRNVHSVSVQRHGQRLCIEIEANAFLLHMVRNIAGSLIEVGAGLQPVSWIQQLLAAKDRSAAAATARPDGLYLVAVSYPDVFNLPQGQPPLFAS